MSKLTENQLAQAIKGITGVLPGPSRLASQLQWCVDNDLFRFPVPVEDWVIHEERIPVIGSIVKCLPRAPLIQLIEQVPDRWWLVSDATQPIKDSLFLCGFVEPSTFAALQLKMNSVYQEFYLNSMKNNELKLMGINIKSYRTII